MAEEKVDKKYKEKEGIIIKVYRSEWKYTLTNQELSLLKSRLSEVMEIDSHTPPGRKIYNTLQQIQDFQKDLSGELDIMMKI